MRSRWMKAAVAVAMVLAILAWCGFAQAAALTASRDTMERTGSEVAFNVASGAVIYAGAMVAVSNGYAYPAADLTGYKVIGRARKTLDNSGSSYKATNMVVAQRGVYCWANGGSFTDANVGELAYVQDDQTVTTAASASSDIVAGVIIDVDSSGVWVDSYALGGQGAASFTTVTASGAASLGSLTVTGSATIPTVGGTTMAVTNNATVAGTLGVTKAATFAADIQANGNVIGDGATVVTNMAKFGLAGLGYFQALSTTGVVFITEGGAATNLVVSW